MNPQVVAFQGEFQFRRYSDTSTQGQQVVFAVSDRAALEAFIGKEGKRFMAVLVEIGDDEQPVVQQSGRPSQARMDAGVQANFAQKTAVSSTSQKPGQLCVMAVNFCKDRMFWKWINENFVGIYDGCSTEEEAKAFILDWCHIDSRTKLDTEKRAADLFMAEIRKPFLAWREKQ